MTENIFNTTRASITVFKQMIDSTNKEHKEALQKISNNYKGDMYIKMRDRENTERKTRLNDLRKAAYNDICEEIKSVRGQILSKMKKRDFKVLNELNSLSGLRLSQAEFNLLYKEYGGNYWNARRLSEIAREQGLEMPEKFAPIDKQLAALDELQEATRLFIFGTDKEAREVFDKYGHRQTFPGYGELGQNSKETLINKASSVSSNSL